MDPFPWSSLQRQRTAFKCATMVLLLRAAARVLQRQRTAFKCATDGGGSYFDPEERVLQRQRIAFKCATTWV